MIFFFQNFHIVFFGKLKRFIIFQLFFNYLLLLYSNCIIFNYLIIIFHEIFQFKQPFLFCHVFHILKHCDQAYLIWLIKFLKIFWKLLFIIENTWIWRIFYYDYNLWFWVDSLYIVEYFLNFILILNILNILIMNV